MPSVSVSANTINPVSGVDYDASAEAKKITRHSQDGVWFYILKMFDRDKNPWRQKDSWNVASMQFPPESAGDTGGEGHASHMVCALYITQGGSWAKTEIFDWNTVCSVNVHNPQTFSFSSYTGGGGLGCCGVIFSDGNGTAQREYTAGDVAQVCSINWGDAQVAPPNIMGTSMILNQAAAVQWVKDFIDRAHVECPHWEGYPDQTEFAQSFEVSSQYFWGCDGDAANGLSNGVAERRVPSNPLWRSDLVN